MGFMRRGNKKGLRKDQVSTVTSSLSIPEHLHQLKLSDTSLTNSNSHGSLIAGAFMSSTEPTGKSAVSSPASLIDDILFELQSTEAKDTMSSIRPAIPENIVCHSALSDTVPPTEINSSAPERFWKEERTAAPAAILTKSARTNTAAGSAVGSDHSINSASGGKLSRAASIDTGSMQRITSKFKRNNVSTPDSDVSDTDTSSTSSTVMSSESGSSARAIQKAPAGSNDRFSKAGVSGPSSSVSSQAIFMARMKERHRQECRKSWQAVPEKLYIQRASSSTSPIYSLDTMISPHVVPNSESFMSFASSSHQSGLDHHNRQRQIVYRPRLTQPLSMPYALDLVSRSTIEVTAPYGSSAISERPSSPKKEDHHLSYHKGVGARQKPDRPLSTAVSPWPSEQQKEGTSRWTSIRSSGSPLITAHQRRVQDQQRELPHVHMPLTPPPDDAYVSPKDSQSSVPEPLNMEKLPRKISSELSQMHHEHSRYSLPDITNLKPSGPSNRRLLKRVSRSMTDLKDGSTQVIDERPAVSLNNTRSDQGVKTTSTVNFGYQQLLPLGETMPTVLVVKGTPDQYYLVMPQHGQYVLHCHDQSHPQTARDHSNTCENNVQPSICCLSYNQASSCYYHQHNTYHHGSSCSNTKNTCLSTGCTKHSKCSNHTSSNSRSCKQNQHRKCHHHQLPASCVIHKEKTFCPHQHRSHHHNHHHHTAHHRAGCAASSHSIASQLKASTSS